MKTVQELATMAPHTVLDCAPSEKKVEGEEPYVPAEHRDAAVQYSNLGALAHMLKSSLSTGLLAMPLAFKNGGLLFGTFGAIIIGVICTHCVDILVRASQAMCVRTRVPALDMAGTAEAAFANGPKPLRRFAWFARAFVAFVLCSTYFVGIVPIVVFVAASVQELVDAYFPESEAARMDPLAYKRIFILAVAPVLVGLSLIRKLKHLVPFSMVANLCMVVGFAITLYYLFAGHRPEETTFLAADPSYVPGIKEISLFCATTLFAMEGIGTVFPVENTMRTPRRMVGWTGVLSGAMIIVLVLYLGLGISGYLRFGDIVKASITLSLPIKEEIPAQIVSALLAIAVAFTFPLQLFVTCEMVWVRLVRPYLPNKKYYVSAETLLRFVLATCVVLMAWGVPNLGPVISLIGSLFLSILGLFIPAVVDTMAFWETSSPRRKMYIAIKNSMIVLLSIYSACAGSYFSVLDILETFAPAGTSAKAHQE